MGDQHPDVAISMNNLAGVLADEGKYEEAEKMHRDALALDRKLHVTGSFVDARITNKGVTHKASHVEGWQALVLFSGTVKTEPAQSVTFLKFSKLLCIVSLK